MTAQNTLVSDFAIAPTTALLALRHINTPCSRCKGTGGYWYGSTSTWRKGVGGCAMTWDVCDACWGSGDAARHWTDLRALQAGEDERVNDEVWSYFAHGIGANLRGMVPALEAIAGELERMSKGRKTRPEWFFDACKILGKRLRSGLEAGQKQRESNKPVSTPSLGQLHALWEACTKWRDKVDPLCRESIYQSDHVNLACPELGADVMEVLGYANHCDGCGERCGENECAKCKEERMPA